MDENKTKNEEIIEEETVEVEEDLDTGAVVDADDELSYEQLSAEYEKAKTKASEMTEMAQRLQAEFDNYRKRNLDTLRRTSADATIAVLGDLLPLTDVIAQALTMINDESVAKGVSMISDEVLKILNKHGIEEIEAGVGAEFDPRYHEVIMQVPAQNEDKPDTINQVFQKGYKLGERVIRPARVIINK
ncbi:MAG: nucleotide exchange factor GrpE [Clostridia bacterium]|nr:nucleotide exchange factor GrpE [Clostridia bacterium]